MKLPIQNGCRYLFYLLLLIACQASAGARWYTYRFCRLIDNPANDGDSFHVRTRSDERIFRLYFVDTPESDKSIPERVKEQAEYWNTTEDEVIKYAAKAKEFTADFLKNEFTVLSKREDARGRSAKDRHFAMIQVKDEYLSEALVRSGLARIYGRQTELPDGTNGKKFRGRLRLAERRAKEEKKGLWNALSPLAARQKITRIQPESGATLELVRSLAVYSDEDRPRLLGYLRQNASLTVGDARDNRWTRISFTVAEKEHQGICRTTALKSYVE